MTRWAALAALVVATSTFVAGCGRASVAGEGRLTPHGKVLVVKAGGASVAISHPTTLRRDDAVHVTSGTADVALPSGSSLSLRAGSIVHFAGGPMLDAGDLLVASKTAPLAVAGPAGTIVVDGISRIRRDLALTVGTYQGRARLTTPGGTLPVPAYRQAAIAGVGVGLLSDHAVPLVLDGNDPWDRRYLGRAIDLTEQLDGASVGFTSLSAHAVATTATFFRQAMVPLAQQPSFTDSLLAQTHSPLQGDRPPGDVLVGAAIALNGQGGSFASRWNDTFAFRDEGAAWGLVALDQTADGAGLIDTIDQAVNRSPLAYAAPAGPAGTGLFDTRQVFVAEVPPTPPTSSNRPPVTSPPTTVPPRPKPPGSPTPTLPPVPVPPTVPTPPPVTVPPPAGSPVSPVVDPIVQLIGQLGRLPLLGGK